MTTNDSPTPLQQDILDCAKRNPNLTKKEISDRCGCSESHVRNTLNQYGDPADGWSVFGL